jgi:WD40 repeat protein
MSHQQDAQNNIYRSFQLHQTLQNYESTAGIFSPDGKTFIVGCQDKTIKIKEIQTGRDLQIINCLTEKAVVLAISRDGSILCAGDDRHGITVWDLQTGKILHSFADAHSNVITSLAISPDGKKLISGSWDWSIKVWSLTSGKTKHHLYHKCGVYAVVIAPDGEKFFSAGNTDEIKIWHCQTGRVLQTLHGHLSTVGALAITKDGKFLASGSQINILQNTFDEVALQTGEYRSIKIWDLEMGQEIYSLTGHEDNICALAISDDGQTLVSGSKDQTIKIWNLATVRLIQTLIGHSHTVRLVALSPDQQILASLGNSTLKFWNLSLGQLISSYGGHTASINCLTLSPDGQIFASGSDDRDIKLWDLQTYQEICTLAGQSSGLQVMATSDEEIVSWDTYQDAGRGRSQPGHGDSILCLVFNPTNPQQLISGSADQTIKIWDLAHQKATHTLRGHQDMGFSLAVHPLGKTLISSSKDKTLKLWNLQTGELVKTLMIESWIRNILVGTDTDTFICGGTRAAIQIRHWETGEILRQIGTETDENLAMALSSDRQLLVSSYLGGIIKIWHLATGELKQTIQLNSNSGLAVAISPDHNLIAATGEDNRIDLYDRQTGVHLQSLLGHQRWGVRSIFLSNDGQSIISGGTDNTIKVWKVPI